MKRMLSMLFLLFCLITSPSLVNSSEMDTSEMKRNTSKTIVYSEVLALDKLEGEDIAAYRHWDSIPLLSPIKIRNINYISSDYGYRNHPVLLKWCMHNGIDISAENGTTVYSTADGIVTKVKKSRRGYGNEIIITHGGGYSTRYAHLEEIFVDEGQRVKAGSYIGTVGTTGLSTGDHLHYEILYNNRSMDPLFFTYRDRRERSITKYFTSLIALEHQQDADRNLTLGMYHKFATNVQVVSSSKIN